MSDISTTNLDAGGDSPRLARAEILETINRVNALTRMIDTSTPNLLSIINSAYVTGNLGMSGNLTVAGTLTLGNGGNAGQVLKSQGAGQPAVWGDIVPGDKYKTTSTTNLTLDNAATKTLNIDPGLSYTAGQSVVVANDATHYFSGTVNSYDSVSGAMTFNNVAQVGSGSFSSWTVNINGAAGNKGDAGTAGSAWYSGAGAPAVGLGNNGDYYLNTTTSDYYTKTAGSWGSAIGNLKGTDGASGSKWYTGAGAPAAGLGADTDMYLNTSNGDYYQKSGGAWGSALGNLTGPGGGGGGGTSTLYGNTSRYRTIFQAGVSVSFVSSAALKTGLAWTRNTTSLTITDNNHGRSVGERAIVRNSNVSQVDGLITAVTTNTFTITCADSGATSGSAAAYSMGFTFAFGQAVGAITSGTIIAPANWDCVLLSFRMHLGPNTRPASQTTFNLTVPKGDINGIGPQTGTDDLNLPVQQVRQDSTAMAAVGNTFLLATAGDYGTYQIGGLPTIAATGLLFTMSF